MNSEILSQLLIYYSIPICQCAFFTNRPFRHTNSVIIYQIKLIRDLSNDDTVLTKFSPKSYYHKRC